MMIAALLKGTRSFAERDNLAARDVLLITLIETGDDLSVSAGPDVFEVARDLDPLTPVALTLTIEASAYRGYSARLRAVKLETGEGDERQVVEEPGIDISAKAVRKQLRHYAQRINS